MKADELQALFAGFVCDKMARAWRNRSLITQGWWLNIARTMLGAGAEEDAVWKRAAALYTACGEYTPANGVFQADILEPVAWKFIAYAAVGYTLHPPVKALSMYAYHNLYGSLPYRAASIKGTP